MMHFPPLPRRLIVLSASRGPHNRPNGSSLPGALVTPWLGGTLVALAFAAVYAVGGSLKPPSEAQWLTNLAASGNSGAQLQLGLAYRDGALGLKPDRAASLHWLRTSAQGGNAYAAQTLQPEGHASRDGAVQGMTLAALATRFHSLTLQAMSVVADLISWASLAPQSATALRMTADGGDPIAQYQLGIRYRDGGWGVERDTAQARSWLTRAAGAGNPLAAQALLSISH
jgi:TPR repeat protein